MHVIQEVEAFHACDPISAETIITAEMERLGASMVQGIWHYAGAPVEITVVSVSRVDRRDLRRMDERRHVGEYVVELLNEIGFRTVSKQRAQRVVDAYWLRPHPRQGRMHIYTSRWDTAHVARDQGNTFALFYTDMGFRIPLWQAYAPEPDFYSLAERLDRLGFGSMEERADLFEQALWLSMQDSARVWLVDCLGFSPFRHDLRMADFVAGSLAECHLWPLTLHVHDGLPGGAPPHEKGRTAIAFYGSIKSLFEHGG